MNTEFRKITFRDLYAEHRDRPTPGQAFIAEVARLTGRAENTVIAWTKGQQTPDPIYQLLIAQHFGISIDTLFPTTTPTPQKQAPL
jgi:transcriptional regulator with XRE-family HTH domain